MHVSVSCGDERSRCTVNIRSTDAANKFFDDLGDGEYVEFRSMQVQIVTRGISPRIIQKKLRAFETKSNEKKKRMTRYESSNAKRKERASPDENWGLLS